MPQTCAKCNKIPINMCYEIHGDNKSIMLCPNCLTEQLYNKTLKLPNANPNKNSEISGQPDTYTVSVPKYCRNNNISYTVTYDELTRLFGHALMPNEYQTLLKTHSASEFELHDDFYTNDGLAIQPIDEDQYINDLTTYASTLPIKEIQILIKWIDELTE